MKKTAIAVAVAVAAFATVAQAAPKDNTWYTGAKLGWSQYQNTGTELGNTGPTHKDQIGAGAYAGFQHNQYMGFELGYDWLGRMPYKGDGNNGAFKAQGIQLTTKLSYPVLEDLDVYTRLGAMVWRADSSYSLVDAGGKRGAQQTKNDTGVSPLVALGTEYAITRDIAARVEYQWVSNIGDKETLGARPDNGMLSVGIAYRFGQDDVAAPVVEPAPAPAPVVENKRFTLRSDVLFNFNKSTLKTEGQEALNQLFNELASIDPTQGNVLVIGYTDRIGSQNYNLPLSQKRAQSVVDYLVAKGIPTGSIRAEGRGKEDPITGNKCDNIKQRAALIECLAPDRRVEIEIQGVTEQVAQAAAAQ